MEITFISKPQTVIWILVTVATLIFYFLMVRPRIKDRPEFQQFRGAVLSWLRVRWDVVTAGMIVSFPSLWNGALDAAVLTSQVLGDLLPAIAGVDLSAYILPDWVTTSIRLGAAAMPVIRSFIERVPHKD